jgi:hypothetical protein
MRRTGQLFESFRSFWTRPASRLTAWLIVIGMPASAVAILHFVVRPSVSRETFRIIGIAVAMAALIAGGLIAPYVQRPRQ